MSGWKPCLIALVLFASFGMAAEAQGIVPGGWSPQFSFQTFNAPGAADFGVSGVYPGYGYGAALSGLSPYGSGLVVPYGPTVRQPYGYYTPPPQTVIAVDPLIGAIRRSTGRKGSR